MSNYKIGDKVIILDGATGTASEHVGHEAEVREIYTSCMDVVTRHVRFPVYFSEVKPAPKNQKIVIATDGKEVLVRLYEGNKVFNRATAKCSPRDKFDFQTGAKIAFDRLMGREEHEKVKETNLLNGKFVCVEPIPGLVQCTCTPGKIYELKNGRFVDDKLSGICGMTHNDYTKVDGLYKENGLWSTGWHFIELKED